MRFNNLANHDHHRDGKQRVDLLLQVHHHHRIAAVSWPGDRVPIAIMISFSDNEMDGGAAATRDAAALPCGPGGPGELKSLSGLGHTQAGSAA
eukprot:3628429-Rhodomonas_salina.1